MENINIEKEVCELAQSFYVFLGDDREIGLLGLTSRLSLRNKALQEASKIVQAKLLSISLNNISESLFHIGNRIYVEPPKFKNVKKD
jgi:hypothetical protein